MKTAQRDLTVAGIITLISGIFFSSLILRIPLEAGQFTKYPVAALQYLKGTISPERLLDFSPLYLGLHIITQYLFNDPALWISWTHITLLALPAGLLYLILRRHAGTLLSLAGAAAFTLSQSVIIYGYVFEPEPLMIFFLITLLFFAERKDLFSSAATGVSLTLCLLTRPTFAPLILLIPLYYWLQTKDRSLIIRRSLVFLAPVLLGILFISGRNYSLQGNFSPLVMNPGNVFFDGNNPLTMGTTGAYPPIVRELNSKFPDEGDYQHEIYRIVARKVSSTNLTVGESNRFWANKVLAFIRDDPGHFLLNTGRRAFHLFHRYRWHDLDVAWNAGEALRGYSIPFIPFALISALALIGLIMNLKSWKTFFLPYAVFFIQAAVISLTFATDRQRACLYPFFVFFAVMGLKSLQIKFRGRAIAAASLLFAIPLLSIDYNRMQDDRHIWEGFSRTFAFIKDIAHDRATLRPEELAGKTAAVWTVAPWLIEAGRPAGVPASSEELAAEALRRLSTSQLDTPSIRLDRAMLMMAAGRLNDAQLILEDLVREGHDFSIMDGRIAAPSYYLGRIAFLQGNRAEAIRMMSRALQSLPGNPVVLAQLACLTGEESYGSKIFRYYDDIDAHFFLGTACLETGESEKAVAHLKQLSLYLPDYPKGLIYLAAALGATGRDTEAAEIYMGTTGGRSDMVILEEMILPVFARLAKDGSPESLYRYGVVLRQYGHFREALQALKQAEEAGSAAATYELRELQDIMAQRPQNLQ